ncbi:hypothetical protein, partial [Dermacoccus nishinomiyaensis]|uniref:hypothetical protein n=1 Tax=Dermacoccus nishinomiyaensis TaxID=1274 RepID=UPI001C92C286
STGSRGERRTRQFAAGFKAGRMGGVRGMKGGMGRARMMGEFWGCGMADELGGIWRMRRWRKVRMMRGRRKGGRWVWGR